MTRPAFADIFSLGTPLSDVIGSPAYAEASDDAWPSTAGEDVDSKLARLIAKRKARRRKD